jgi:hypothetical protein
MIIKGIYLFCILYGEDMSLQERFGDELKTSMKAKDTDRIGAIRILIGEFQRQPEKTLNDEKVIAIIKQLIKSERELLAATKQMESFCDAINLALYPGLYSRYCRGSSV